MSPPRWRTGTQDAALRSATSVTAPSVELRPVFSLRTTSFSRAAYESRIVGDGDVGQPVTQPPLLIDLTKVPNRML
jgi:hypothetical protein